MVEVSGNELEEERSREYHGNWTEFKFVFKSYSGVVARITDLIALQSSMSRMETITSNRSAIESWQISIKRGWDKGKHKSQKEQGKKNTKKEWSNNCGKWGHNDASAWLEREKKVNLVMSSSSSTLVATDVDTKRSWDSSSRREKMQRRTCLRWSLVLWRSNSSLQTS